MASSESWMCDGIPKNGKEYPGLGGAHGPYENDSPYCGDCGLPRESSIALSESSIQDSKPFWSITTLILLALTGIIAVASGAAVYKIVNLCEQGLEKIDGQCIDPFLQPYQEATQKGDQAIENANKYQTLEDLEIAKSTLTNVLEQLNEIPQTALVYPEVTAKLEEYDLQRSEIINNIANEKTAQKKLQEIETIAKVAKGQTEIAKTTFQLEIAKQKWQEAKNKLNKIDNTPLITNQIQQHKSEYDREINKIEQQISRIEEENRIREEMRLRRAKTDVPPQVITPLRKKINITPKNIPYDPCAVKNPPPNCLF